MNSNINDRHIDYQNTPAEYPIPKLKEIQAELDKDIKKAKIGYLKKFLMERRTRHKNYEC